MGRPLISDSVLLEPQLTHLESIWESGMRDSYLFYRAHAEPRVALAAAMVEAATQLQQLGGPAASPQQLLLGDLCLARASQLLAGVGDQRLQVGFARAVEQVASAAAGAEPLPELREQLLAVVRGRA